MSETTKLTDLIQKAIALGPNEVLVDKHGTILPQPVYPAFQFPVNYIFVREDGWSLGASYELAGDANGLWDWVAVISMPSKRVRRYRYNGDKCGT